MRWHGILAMVVVAACYSPTARPGAPCTLELDNCPSGQRCELVAGESICVEAGGGSGVIDAADDARPTSDAPPGDAPVVDMMMIDMMPPADSSPAGWTLVQVEGESGNDVTFDASGAGNLLVVGIETSAGGAVTTVTDNVGNTYVRATGSRGVNAQQNFGAEIWYAVNAIAGANRIVATAGTVYGVVVWEVAGMGAVTLGNVAKLDDQPATTTPRGAPIATTTAGEFVVSIVIVQLSVSPIMPSSEFTNDESVFMNGWAHLTSNAAPPDTYTAEWNATNGVYCASSAAFRKGP